MRQPGSIVGMFGCPLGGGSGSEAWHLLLRDLLTVIKGFRNGLVYGVKIRLPHAAVMPFLFRSEAPYRCSLALFWRDRLVRRVNVICLDWGKS